MSRPLRRPSVVSRLCVCVRVRVRERGGGGWSAAGLQGPRSRQLSIISSRLFLLAQPLQTPTGKYYVQTCIESIGEGRRATGAGRGRGRKGRAEGCLEECNAHLTAPLPPLPPHRRPALHSIVYRVCPATQLCVRSPAAWPCSPGPGAISADMRSHPERDAFPIPLLPSPSARERAAGSTSHQLICSRNQIAAGGWGLADDDH